jgi:hypothetical protein
LDVVIDPGPEQGRTVVEEGTTNALVCLEPDTAQVKFNAAGILGQP